MCSHKKPFTCHHVTARLNFQRKAYMPRSPQPLKNPIWAIRAHCVNTKLQEWPEAQQTHNAGFAHVHIFHFWALIANTCTDIHNQFSKKALRVEWMKRECTYCLTDDGVFDLIDAAGKHSKGQSRVEAEVEEHMPSLPTDADCAAKKRQRIKQISRSVPYP